MRDGVHLSLEELLGAVENRVTWLSVESSYGPMLAELLKEKVLKSCAKCVRKWVVVERSHVYNGDT